jgi:hypothetical protein
VYDLSDRSSVRCSLVRAAGAVAVAAVLAIAPHVAVAAGPLPAGRLPDFMKPGARITFEEGQSTNRGTRLVRDPKLGRIQLPDGDWYREEDTGTGTGGVGLLQINLLLATPQSIVADGAMFQNTDVARHIHVTAGAVGIVGNAERLGVYWIHPARLAAMEAGKLDDATKVWRGVRRFGDRNVNVVSIATATDRSYASNTYDVESGIRLFGGSTDMDVSTFLKNFDGTDGGVIPGRATVSHSSFVGIRQTTVPWAAAPAPVWATKGRQMAWQGQQTMTGTGLVAPAATIFATIKDVTGSCAIASMMFRTDNGPGLPPTDSSVERAFGSAMFNGIWLPPAAMASLSPNAVLDEDPTSGYRILVGGVSNGVASIAEQGPQGSVERFYDVGSGVLSAFRITRMTPGVGPSVTEYRLMR